MPTLNDEPLYTPMYSSPLSICLVSGYPPNIGRGAESTSILVSSLKSQVEVSRLLILGNKLSEGLDEPSKDGIDVHRVWSPNSFRSLKDLSQCLIRNKTDIVHIIYGYLYYGKPFFSAIFILSLLAQLKFLHRKVILTIHQVFSIHELEDEFIGTFAGNLPTSFVKLGFVCLNRILGALSLCVIVTHPKHSQILMQEYRLKNVLCIPIGLSRSLSISKAEAKKKLNLRGKHLLLIFGFISPLKGVEYAIYAMHHIVGHIKGAILVIAGTALPSYDQRKSKSYLEHLRKIINSLSIGEFVIFENRYLTDDEIALYFAASDAIIMPNIMQTGPSEIWRLATIHGLPAIASDIEYFRMDIEDRETGLLFSVGNPDSLASAVEDILSNEDLRKSIIENLKPISEVYLVKNVARQHLNLYQKLVCQKS